MTGFERLKEQAEGQKDMALLQTVDFLLTRKDMEQKYLNEEKSLAEMGKFIREKGQKLTRNGWNYITNEVVYAWAIMYFSLPNKLLKIKDTPVKKDSKKDEKSDAPTKNNVIPIEKAKKVTEKKKEIEQISLFGGVS